MFIKSRAEYDAEKLKAKTDKETVYLSADLQKVVLLPRMPSYKKCIFTTRLITFNMTFAPIGDFGVHHNIKALGLLWHEEIMGRKDEDITSAYWKMFFSRQFRDILRFVIWADNCGGQNKCWTLFTMLVLVVTITHVEQVTLKYFTVGHSFMSADNFHRNVEKEMKAMDKVYDFDDFIKCVENVGIAQILDFTDFYNFESGLSEGKASKTSRPLLANVKEVEFRKGSLNMFYKCFEDDEFREANFLKAKTKKSISDMPLRRTEKRGICEKKKSEILKNLSTVFPATRRSFFENLLVNDDSVDLMTERE